MNLLLAPHNDDESLFCAYTMMREKPLVVIVTDGIIHQQRFGIDPEVRREESRKACNIARCEVQFLGIPDNDCKANDLKHYFSRLKGFNTVYAPAIDGGNKTHDLVSEIAWLIFKDKCVFYPTYSKLTYQVKGDIEIIPTEKEKERKIKMLKCYKSQLGINRPHFDAVWGKPEYYE